MEIDFLSKIAVPIAALIASALFQLPTMRKTWDELKHLRRDRRKREAEFALKFFEQCGDPRVRLYAEDLGYAALIGDRHLNTEERRFLLSLKDPERMIDRYLRAFPLVSISINQRRLAWKAKRHTSKLYRSGARAGYLIAYIAGAIFASLPILLRDHIDPDHKLPAIAIVIPLIYCMSMGVPFAFFCLRRSVLLGEAERLIETHETIDEANAVERQLVVKSRGSVGGMR
ncbi:hypothetical protein [Burkholderia ubonensis]|uniref:hypothetical protein n=1 Tax=Burkholderia ubonensis TaxID=101571 RepID=UPI00116022E0|nr:hypothetical protein [Burkholderia ubonensis]